MTSARLRKTFRYPTDETSDDDMPQELDEEGHDRFLALREVY